MITFYVLHIPLSMIKKVEIRSHRSTDAAECLSKTKFVLRYVLFERLIFPTKLMIYEKFGEANKKK